MREVISVTSIAVLGPGCSQPWNWEKGLREGSPESSWLINLVLWHVLEPLVEKWRNPKYGIFSTVSSTAIHFGLMTLSSFAHRFHLLRLCSMILQLRSQNSVAAYPKKFGRCANKHTVGKHTGVLTFEGNVYHCPGNLLCLGIWLGTDYASLNPQARCARGWQVFWSKSSVLCDSDLSVVIRLKLLWKEVVPAIFYGSETWVCSNSLSKNGGPHCAVDGS